MAVLTGFLRPGPTTIWSFPPMKIYQVWSFHKNRKLTNIFFFGDLQRISPNKTPPPKKKRLNIWSDSLGKVEKPIFLRVFFLRMLACRWGKGWVGMGHKKTSRGVAFLGSVGRGVKPKVVRKLLVEKPLFAMGQKNPELHKIVGNCFPPPKKIA